MRQKRPLTISSRVSWAKPVPTQKGEGFSLLLFVFIFDWNADPSCIYGAIKQWNSAAKYGCCYVPDAVQASGGSAAFLFLSAKAADSEPHLCWFMRAECGRCQAPCPRPSGSVRAGRSWSGRHAPPLQCRARFFRCPSSRYGCRGQAHFSCYV